MFTVVFVDQQKMSPVLLAVSSCCLDTGFINAALLDLYGNVAMLLSDFLWSKLSLCGAVSGLGRSVLNVECSGMAAPSANNRRGGLLYFHTLSHTVLPLLAHWWGWAFWLRVSHLLTRFVVIVGFVNGQKNCALSTFLELLNTAWVLAK